MDIFSKSFTNKAIWPFFKFLCRYLLLFSIFIRTNKCNVNFYFSSATNLPINI